MAPTKEARRDERRHVATGSAAAAGSPRSAAQRDRDRILYASAFRRLSGVTQVASPAELSPVHNRMSHSLKVAQVGRALARTLLVRDDGKSETSAALAAIGGLDPDAVEAACLAHDLGHPPFGHVAEAALDELLVKGGIERGVPDGFNGNAQSFRIVTRLAVKHTNYVGLDLTRATLNGVLKYPWTRENHGHRNEKWGAYDSELDDFHWSRAYAPPVLDGKTLEAALMDWADDITYAVHDVEDFFRAGLIPLDDLAKDRTEQQHFFDWAVAKGKVRPDEIERLSEAFLRTEFIDPGAPPGPYRGSRSDRAWLRNITSELIGRLVEGSVSLQPEGAGARLAIDPDMVDEVRMLKLLTWRYVIDTPSLVTQRFGQRMLIESLFRTFVAAAGSPRDWGIFPRLFQEEIELAGNSTKAIKRIVADLISSMSEAQAIAIHERLTGQSLGSAMDAYLQ